MTIGTDRAYTYCTGRVDGGWRRCNAIIPLHSHFCDACSRQPESVKTNSSGPSIGRGKGQASPSSVEAVPAREASFRGLGSKTLAALWEEVLGPEEKDRLVREARELIAKEDAVQEL